MRARTSKPCRKCKRALTRDRSGFCDKCKPADSTNWNDWQARKGNRHKRGYGANWEKLRAVVLERDEHLCVKCLSEGIFTQATHVDHITPKSKGGCDDEDNLQSLCRACHAAKTARE